LTILREIFFISLQCSTATTRLGRAHNNINTKDNKYNRHATTNPISLSLVTEVKEKNISLRMVKN
jgi:hypothetical protein